MTILKSSLGIDIVDIPSERGIQSIKRLTFDAS